MNTHGKTHSKIRIPLRLVALAVLLLATASQPVSGRVLPCNPAAGTCADQQDSGACPGDYNCACLPGENGPTWVPDNIGGGCSSCQGGSGGGVIVVGMPAWWVSEPYINLRIEDRPLGYQPALGRYIGFDLSYRQRGFLVEDPAIFGVGTNWSCSFKSYLITTGTSLVRLHRGGAGVIDYSLNAAQFRDGSVLSTPDSGLTYEITYRDGAQDIFTNAVTDNLNRTLFFLTARTDPQGHTTRFHYSSTPDLVQLTSVEDPDGRSTSLYYENTSFPLQITRVVDPFNRTSLLQYDPDGYLTNIVDVAGLASGFTYDTGSRRGWITSMTTPYGTTSFRFEGIDAGSTEFYTTGGQVNRSVEVTLPTGGKHLYLYRQDCSAFMSSQYAATPQTYPVANTVDNVDQQNRNSFYWGPLQYSSLSANFQSTGAVADLIGDDYTLGRLRHWLVNPSTAQVSGVLSLERAPKRTDTEAGQITWYDYESKLYNNYLGTTALPRLKARVLPDNTTWFEHYARNGRGLVTQTIATWTDLNGAWALRTNTFVYGANLIDLELQIGPSGGQVVSNYFGNAFHQPDASYDALNQETRYTYNANWQLTEVDQPGGLTTLNLYGISGAAAHRLERTIDVEILRTNAYTYHGNGLVESHTDARGLAVTNTWDALQRLTSVRYPDGTTRSNVYTALDLTATKDRLGHWSYAGYNANRQKVAETNVLGVVTRYGYCDCGVLYAVTNAWGTAFETVSAFGYDYQGHRLYSYLPDITLTNGYNSLGQKVQTLDADGVKYFYYNNQGLVTNVSNAYGTRQATLYNVDDRPVYTIDANGVTVTNTYDGLGRLRSRGYPDGGMETFGYSALGLAAYTNQLAEVTYYGYDPARRKSAETNANLEVIRYTNSPAGDLLSLTDGKNQTTRWAYDPYGQVTNKLDQAGVEILRYRYDAEGRLTNRWSKAKGDTYYTLDDLGNLTFINYPSSPDVTFGYDPLNRLTNMVDAVGTTAYGYTAGGQLLTEDGPWASDTVTNTYANRLRTGLGLQQPTGAWTNGFAYDNAGRLTGVVSPAGSFDYLLTGAGHEVQRLTLPNSAYITNTFDPVARLLSTTLKNSSHSTLSSHAYTYNLAGQRAQQAYAGGDTVDYSYDPIGQLRVADSSVGWQDRGYLYDAAWNLNYRTNSGVLVTAYQVDSRNQLTAAGSQTCSYDDNGNLAQASTGSSLTAYVYDDENRLVMITNGPPASPPPQVAPMRPSPLPGWRTDLVYDGLGRLRLRHEYSNTVNGWWLDGTTLYIYDGNRVIQERNGTMVPTVSYTRGSDLSGSLEGAGGIGGLLARSTGTGSAWTSHAYYHADGNGNVTCLVDASQSVVAAYRYDPFGNTLTKTGTLADANLYRFSSKELHAKSGTYYYLYRFYDPNLQRWLNRDPLGEQGGVNLYSFALNIPTKFVDPFGEAPAQPTWPGQLWPPPNPWPTSPISVDAGKGGIGINSGNAPVARPARAPRPCTPVGATSALRPAGTQPTECPCTGKQSVPCSQYDECIFWSMSLSGVVQGTWVTKSVCHCPEGDYRL